MFKSMKKRSVRFLRDECGATLVEYGLALTLGILIGTTALLSLSTEIGSSLTSAATAMPD